MFSDLKGKSYLSTADLSSEVFSALIDLAIEGKKDKGFFGKPLAGKSVGLLFFNSSLRTRTSMAVAVHDLGGHAMVLDVSSSMWKLETRDGVVMSSDKPEHIKEAIGVLSSYVDIIGVRCFSDLTDYKKDRDDPLIRSIEKHSFVPVINLESAMHHPCQSLADMMTIKEKIGAIKGQKVVLSWAPHPKPLPLAVANSFALASCQSGADLHIVNPKGYDLDEGFLAQWRKIAISRGGNLTQSHNQEEAFSGAKIVYAKSWGSLAYYGQMQEEEKRRAHLGHWTIDKDKMARTDGAYFMHCLPVRRNVVVTDEVIDSKSSVVISQAANRLYGQKAVLAAMMG